MSRKRRPSKHEDRRPDVENGDLENQDPLKITWKRLETANNYFQTLHKCKKQHVFQLSKILTRVFLFQTQKTKTPLKITWKRQSVQQLFSFPFSQSGITCKVLTSPPSLKIFAPLRCRLLTSLTSIWLKGNGKIVMFLTLLLCLEVVVGSLRFQGLRFPGLENEDPVQNFG